MSPRTHNVEPVTQGSTSRPPVVVIMGHIDHGKSTLLDYIRKSNIVAHEAGGITQHLGAYEVEHTSSEGKKGTITFLDTPGHAAFSGIRSRGAKVADIAILVVSAEDGVKPQTLEALNCIKKEQLPFIVAINKIDKPGADPERTKLTLAEAEVYVEGYGGDTPVVNISALKGTGIPDLLDMIMLVAELEDLTADHSAPAQGVIIEANLDTKKGVSATVIVTNGTITSGDFIVAENAFAPIRIMENYQGKLIKSAIPSSPVKIIGWNAIPRVGSTISIVATKKEAEAEVLKNINLEKELKLNTKEAMPVEEGMVYIPLIIKADVTGSIEGIHHELKKIGHPKVKIHVISEGIGDITEADVKAAIPNPDTIIVAFNTKVDTKARAVIERTPVTISTYTIIYELIDYLKGIVTSKIPKEFIEEITGKGKILALFGSQKDRRIIGLKVTEGTLRTGNEVRIMRRDVQVAMGKIREIQVQKVKGNEVREGFECGMMIECSIEIAVGDKIEAFHTVEKTAEKSF